MVPASAPSTRRLKNIVIGSIPLQRPGSTAGKKLTAGHGGADEEKEFRAAGLPPITSLLRDKPSERQPIRSLLLPPSAQVIRRTGGADVPVLSAISM